MWLKRFTHYLLQHRWATLALTFLIAFVPFIGSFGILIAAFVTLRKGVVEGAILTLAATLPCGLSLYHLGNHDLASTPALILLGVGATALINVLTWTFAVLLRRHQSWSSLFQLSALLSVLAVSIVHLVYPDISEWWVNVLTRQAQLVAGTLKNASAGMIDQQAQVEAIKLVSEYATGMLAATVLFFTMTQLVVARWWELVVFQSGSLRKELQSIRLSHLAGILFIVSLVLAYYGNIVVIDVMPILYLLFSVTGLCIIHFVFGLMRTPATWIWMLLIYAILVFTVPASFFFLSVLGLIDIWLDIRKRLKTV